MMSMTDAAVDRIPIALIVVRVSMNTATVRISPTPSATIPGTLMRGGDNVLNNMFTVDPTTVNDKAWGTGQIDSAIRWIIYDIVYY